MNKKFVSKSNRVLRNVLNSKDNLDILQDFIQVFLNISIKEIKLNPYLKIKSKYLPEEENFGIADVRVKLENNEELNIGIQVIDGYYVQNKMLIYYAQIHSNQLEYENRKIAKTITINILDFPYFNTIEYHKKISIKTMDYENDNIELYVLELPKFHISEIDSIGKKESWMIYLCGNEGILLNNIKKKYKEINKLDNLLEKYWKKEKME